MKRKLRYIMSVVAYLLCIGVAVAIAVMIDGSGGVMIGAILILALIISQLAMLLQRKKISAEIVCSQKLLSKGDKMWVQVKLSKRSFLPTPFIEIEVEASPQLKAEDKLIYRLSLSSVKKYEDVKIPFSAVHCGLSFVGIKRIELVDFLGITRFSISKGENLKHEIRILPNIPDTGAQPDILKTTSENATFDDSEEETDQTAVGSTGVPGYEHRAYSPGDPLKKINWKLSSKRDIFMVRLDEKPATSSQTFILDFPAFEEGEEYDPANVDIVIEGCLAMLAMLVSQGLESVFYYWQGEWQSCDVKSMTDVVDLQERLSWACPATASPRLPDEPFKKGGAVCFSTVNSAHGSLASELFSRDNLMLVLHENSGFSVNDGNVWSCSADFEFKKLGN